MSENVIFINQKCINQLTVISANKINAKEQAAVSTSDAALCVSTDDNGDSNNSLMMVTSLLTL